jgi:hypothetical protein
MTEPSLDRFGAESGVLEGRIIPDPEAQRGTRGGVGQDDAGRDQESALSSIRETRIAHVKIENNDKLGKDELSFCGMR